jgi:hypothetical protein
MLEAIELYVPKWKQCTKGCDIKCINTGNDINRVPPHSLHEVIYFKGMHTYLSSSVPLSLWLLRQLLSPALNLTTLEVITLSYMYVGYFHCKQCIHYLWYKFHTWKYEQA